MFQSATIKLTGWYLLILMAISMIFSVAIYANTSHEVEMRLTHLETSYEARGDSLTPTPASALRSDEASAASSSILLELVYANLIILAGGGLVSYLFARRTLRPIKEAHEAQSRFTSDASHELRTPLAAMKAEIEVALRDKSAGKSEYREVLASNLEEVEKLTALSEMLLHLSRLEHDKLEQGAINLYELTGEVKKLYKKDADRIVITAGKKLLVLANRTAVSELISILIDNALKYSPKKSTVTITITAKEEKVSFEIANEGKGIDAERMPHIFDRFYQVDTSRTAGESKGYGLGLSLAKRIVELQDGDLTATSGTDQVTIFTVLLPMYHKPTNS